MKKLLSVLLVLLLAMSLLAQTKIGGAGKLGGTVKSGASGGGGTTLNTGLESYWKMDEVSGTRDDAQGANDLTDVNTVGSTAGIISNAANFDSLSSEQFTRSDNVSLSIGSGVSFSYTMWVRLNEVGSTHAFVSKDNGSTDREYIVFYSQPFDRIRAFFQTTGGFVAVNADVLGPPSINTIYFIAFTFNHTTNTSSLYVGTTSSLGAANTAVGSGTGLDTAAQFEIGSGASGAGNFMEGWIDEVGFWKKELSSAEVTELWDSGTGKTCCPF